MNINDLWGKLYSSGRSNYVFSQLREKESPQRNAGAVNLVAGSDYFTIRILETRLKESRKLWSEYTPMVVVVTKCIYGDSPVVIPFILSNKSLEVTDFNLSNEFVDFYNIPVAGPIPYVDGEISLFVGLYALQINDIAKELFNIVQGITKEFDSSLLSSYLNIAGPLGDGLDKLLGLKQMDLKFGVAANFQIRQEAPYKLRDSYLICSNIPGNNVSIPDLYVEDGKLQSNVGGDVNKFRDSDYCLLRIEKSTERSEYVTLPFHKHWNAAKQYIWSNNPEYARQAIMELSNSIAMCDDVAMNERNDLMLLYEVKFQKEVDMFKERNRNQAKITAASFRGGDNKRGAREYLENIAYIAERRKFPQAQVDSFLKLSEKWEIISEQLPSEYQQKELTSAEIHAQLNLIKEINRDNTLQPRQLADVITIATLGA